MAPRNRRAATGYGSSRYAQPTRTNVRPPPAPVAAPAAAAPAPATVAAAPAFQAPAAAQPNRAADRGNEAARAARDASANAPATQGPSGFGNVQQIAQGLSAVGGFTKPEGVAPGFGNIQDMGNNLAVAGGLTKPAQAEGVQPGWGGNIAQVGSNLSALAAPAAGGGYIKPAAEASVGNVGGWGNIQQAGQSQIQQAGPSQIQQAGPNISQMRRWQNTGFGGGGGFD